MRSQITSCSTHPLTRSNLGSKTHTKTSGCDRLLLRKGSLREFKSDIEIFMRMPCPNTATNRCEKNLHAINDSTKEYWIFKCYTNDEKLRIPIKHELLGIDCSRFRWREPFEC